MAEERRLDIADLTDLVAQHIAEEKSHPRRAGVLHRWWAVRPAVLARVATYLALSERPEPEGQLLDGLSRIPPTSAALVEALAEIRETQWRWAWRERNSRGEALTPDPPDLGRPRVLDPFAGAGPIPSEASRLACQTDAGDLHPIAYHILRARLEYPVLFGFPATNDDSESDRKWRGLVAEIQDAVRQVESVWGQRVAKLYPARSDEDPPRFYLWFTAVDCPTCGTAYSFQPAIRVGRDRSGLRWLRVVVRDGVLVGELSDEPGPGIPNRGPEAARTNCPACASPIAKQEALNTTKLVLAAVAWDSSRIRALTAQEAAALLPWTVEQDERLESLLRSDLASALSEPSPVKSNDSQAQIRPRTFRDLFTRRQLLTNLELAATIHATLAHLDESGLGRDQVDALRTYLAFFQGYVVERNTMLCMWQPDRGVALPAFGRVTIIPRVLPPRVFAEIRPVNMHDQWLARVIPAVEAGMLLQRPTRVFRADAAALPHEDETFDAIITDPPYFDLVPYEDLAAFFWAWEVGFLGAITPAVTTRPAHVKDDFGSAGASGHMDEQRAEQANLFRAFKEAYRVLKPGRIFSMLLTTRTREHFEDYVQLAQRAGFELTNVRSIREAARTRQIETREQEPPSTFLIYFRKPVFTATTRLSAEPAMLLAAAAADRPILYDGLARTLIEELPPDLLDELIPSGARGTTVEKLMEVLAVADPRQILEQYLGRLGIVRLVRRLGIEAGSDTGRTSLELLLGHFGLTVPTQAPVTGVEQTLAALTRMRGLVLAAKSKADIRGPFLEGSTVVERLVRTAVWGWAQLIFGSERDAELLKTLGRNPDKTDQLQRLTFGNVASLFRRLPQSIADSPHQDLIAQKFGRDLAYMPTDGAIGDLLENLVDCRNRVEHDRDGYWSGSPVNLLIEDSAAALIEAKEFVSAAAAAGGLPRIAIATYEVKDRWGRISYRLDLDDGSQVEAYFSKRLSLGSPLLYFGTGTNPRPVDPLILPLAELGLVP